MAKLKKIILEEIEDIINEIDYPPSLTMKRDESPCDIEIGIDDAEHEYVDLPSEVDADSGFDSLLSDLHSLLETWPACRENPNSWACKYHKDLEKVVERYKG